MDEWLNGRMTMMTTTATTIFDATTGTLSPKVQSLVSSRVHLGKVFFRPVVPLYSRVQMTANGDAVQMLMVRQNLPHVTHDM